MGISSSQLRPQELVTFKKLPTDVPLDNIEIPERPENRRPTDKKWLIVLGAFVLVFLPFFIYTMVYADVNRIIVGYDKCGNICGQKNYQWHFMCSGKNMTDYPYLQYETEYIGGSRIEDSLLSERECVESCKSGYSPILGRCLRGDNIHYANSDSYDDREVNKVKYDQDTTDIGVYLDSVKWQIVISCLLSILVAMGMLFLFRYAVEFVVWGIMFGCILAIVIVTLVFWYFYLMFPSSPDEEGDAGRIMLGGGIMFTVLAIVLAIIVIWSRKKIHLVVLLLKETTKAVFDIPRLMIIPVICVSSILILTFLFALTTFYMASAGTLERIYEDFYIYISNSVMDFTIYYNIVVYLWLFQFFTGIQYMIVAGAASKWYFSRDKNLLGSPIMTAVSNTFRFHLGTVALGALIITIIQIIKTIILGLINNEKFKAVIKSIIEYLETFFKFLSKNAYIITAMHGQSFIRSGKRAAKLIVQNISDIIAVNFIGDFVLGMAKILIVIVSVLLSMVIFAIAPSSIPGSNILPYIIVGVVALVVACVAFGVFETTIDTIFICYCEDSLLNDGMARPYFMSRNLMEFVQSSKGIYGKKGGNGLQLKQNGN